MIDVLYVLHVLRVPDINDIDILHVDSAGQTSARMVIIPYAYM